MPGLGRKVFTAGEVLTAANVNGYLMDQSVMVFASASAASSAVGTAISEGMQFYLSDTDEQVFYNGSSFAKQNGTTNAIINGAFDIWQRGTSFSGSSQFFYTADRWESGADTTFTVSRQTFTPGTAPVAGYEFPYFFRFAKNSGGTFLIFRQRIEDVRSFAGQTITVSFWAKADSAASLSLDLSQNFGSGGSATVVTSLTAQSLTTSWARYTATVAVPSISGKTVGTSSYLELQFSRLTSSAWIPDIVGVQLEAGSVATPFKRNAPSIQAELAACQRYNYRVSADASTPYTYFGNATAGSTTTLRMPFYTRTSLRTFISSVEWGGSIIATTGNGSTYAITNIAIDTYSKEVPALVLTVASGLTTNTTYIIRADNSSTAYIGFSAEL